MRSIITLVSILLSISLFAQSNNVVEELLNKKWTFLIEKAEISPADAEKIKPLFMTYEKSVWKFAESNREKAKNFYKNKQTRTAEDYKQMNQQYVSTEMQRAQQLKIFYNRLQKTLTEEQIFRYMMAERSYKRELMENWKSHNGKKGK